MVYLAIRWQTLKIIKMKYTYLLALPILLMVACGTPEEKTTDEVSSTEATVTSITSEKRDNYSPYVGDDYPQNVYFGDLHLHTSFSVDAGLNGCRLGPEDAYRFASGEEVVNKHRPKGKTE